LSTFNHTARVYIHSDMDESESLNVKVEACTSSDLPECDWSLVFEIVDDTNVDPSFAREIVRSLRARLSSPNPKVVLLAITVSLMTHIVLESIMV
jgi:hypothetical protein